MPHLPRATDLDLRDQIKLLSGADVWNTAAVPGVRSVRMNDGPHGMRVQLDDSDHLGLDASEPATCFPTAVTLASTWDPELVAQVGAAVAEEAKALGVSLVLGPGLNIKRHPLCGRNFEYFSEDPLVSGRMAAGLVSGIQSRGIGACIKHFAANNAESHRFVSDSVVDPRTLREIYLSAFEHVVRTARPWAVMASYNLLNGTQVTEDPWLLTDVLRTEWGFEGLVVSDWGATADRVAGIRAGMDLEMPGGHRLSDAEVRAAVAAGDLAAEEVATCAQRVIDHVARCPEVRADPARLAALAQEHDALARYVAAAGAVLLSNDGILPLAPDTDLALIGAFARTPRFQGAGSSLVNAPRVTTLADALTAAGVEYTYAAGYDPTGGPAGDPAGDPASDPAGAPAGHTADSSIDQRLIDEAVEFARSADVAVVLVGLPGVMESEGFDRDHLRLPAQHDALVWAVAAVNPRTVVLLANGAPVLMPWRDEVAAVLECYLGGQAGGGAMADLLLGVSEPGGRLAESFPAQREDVSADPWFPGSPGAQERQLQYREGLFVGYRHHVSAGIEPLWAFGHGLGWTRVEWGPAAASTTTLLAEDLLAGDGVEVTLQLTNPSRRSTSEVVQVYRHDRSAVVLRPRRELVGWAKVHLGAGESQQVSVQVPGRSFAFFDLLTDTWQVPSGPVDLEVARSSVAVESTVTVQVTGGVTRAAEGPDAPRLARSEAEFSRRFGQGAGRTTLPAVRPVRPFTRNSTVEEIATTRVGAKVRAAILAQARVEEAADPATRLMIERSVEELPVRAVAAFGGGRITWRLVDALLAVLNRRPLAAVRTLTQGVVAKGPRWLRPRGSLNRCHAESGDGDV